MDANFTDAENTILAELVYLGNWLVNATRMPDKQIVKYAETAANFLKKTSDNYNEENLHDDVEDLIQYYDQSIAFREFAKQYANYHFPYEQRDIVKNKVEFEKQFTRNRVLKQLCEKELEENKFLNVIINILNLKDEIDSALQKNEV